MNKQTTLNVKLQAVLHPNFMQIVNESYMHGAPEQESHFNVLVVSQAFDGLSLLAQQRLVYEALKNELKEIHAFSLKTMTPKAWEAAGRPGLLASPACQGGSKIQGTL